MPLPPNISLVQNRIGKWRVLNSERPEECIPFHSATRPIIEMEIEMLIVKGRSWPFGFLPGPIKNFLPL